MLASQLVSLPALNETLGTDVQPGALNHYSVACPGGRGLLGSIFAGYVPLASPSPYPIIGLFCSQL